MTTDTRPVLDLLRERRRELGLEPLAATLAQRRGLLQRGALIGLALAGTMAGLCAVVILQHALVKSRMARLNAVEAEAQQLEIQLKGVQQKLQTTKATNQSLANVLTSGRTAAALLAELQRITPQGVQLTAADLDNDSLDLKGQADDPYALVRINALQLQLQRSSLVKADGVRLTKVERRSAAAAAMPASAGAGGGGPEGPVPLGFELSASLSALDPSDQMEVLTRLGSEGMARRLRLLREEGLLP
ncbi:MAG: PilN domain-containing protein [Cyanobium sp.]